MQPFEVIKVDSVVVACNGGGGPLGHPKVYLNLAPEGKIECPYCSRLFVRETHRDADVHGHSVALPGAAASGKH